MNLKCVLSLLSFTVISYSSEPVVKDTRVEISCELVASYNAIKAIQKVAKICAKELELKEEEAFFSNPDKKGFMSFNSGIMLCCGRRPLSLSTPFGGFCLYGKSNVNRHDEDRLDNLFRMHMAKRGFSLNFMCNVGEHSRNLSESEVYEIAGVGVVTKEKLRECRGKNVKVIGSLKEGTCLASFYEVSNIGDEHISKARYGQLCGFLDKSLEWRELEKRDVLKRAAWRRLTMTGSLGIEPLIRQKITKK